VRYRVNSKKALYEFLDDACKMFEEIHYFNATLTDKRSLDQNALKEVWYKEISERREDMSINDVRRECKLLYGVPILRRDSDMDNWLFQQTLDKLDHERKLKVMDSFDITSKMSTPQMKEYLNEINLEYPWLE